MNDFVDFHRWLSSHVRVHGQRRASRMFNVPRTTIQHLLNGGEPSPKTLDKFGWVYV